jgi:hypothetical protein
MVLYEFRSKRIVVVVMIFDLTLLLLLNEGICMKFEEDDV